MKRSIISPVSGKIEVPIIEKRKGQVLSASTNSVQLMDLETYAVFEKAFPDEEELNSGLTNGIEIEYWKILGKVKIVKIK